MDISIGKLKITTFCKDNIEHIKFKKDILEDGLTLYYFPNFNEENFLVPSYNNEFKIRNFYLVKDINELIGWIYIGGFEKQITLDCGIHPQFRRKGYQTLLLEECRNYLFQNDLADIIEIMIKNNNIGSLKAADKAKYKKLGKVGSYYIFKSAKVKL